MDPDELGNSKMFVLFVFIRFIEINFNLVKFALIKRNAFKLLEM